MAQPKRKTKASSPKGGPRSAPSPRTARPSRGVFAAVLLAAIAVSLVTWLPAKSEFEAVDMAAAIAGGIGLLAAIGVAVRSRAAVRFGRVGIAWAAFLGVALMSALLSGRGWSAFMGEPTNLLGWGTLAAVTAVSLAGALDADRIRDLLGRYAWLVIALEILVLVGELVFHGSPSGTLPNSSYFGAAMLVLLPWTLVRRAEMSTNEWYARLATVALAVAALAASGARVALVFALVWVVWTLVRGRGLSPKTRAGIAVAVVVLAAAGALLFARAEFLASVSRATLGDRPVEYRMALHAAEARPVFGWGPDGFRVGGSAISTQQFARQLKLIELQPGYTDPHDLLLWIAVSTGLVGLALFAWFAIEVVLGWVARRGGEGLSPAVWGVAGCLFIYLTAPASLLTLPLFAVVLGVSLAPREPQPEAPTPPALTNTVLAVLVLASALLTLNALCRAPFETPAAAGAPSKASAAQSMSDVWSFDPHLAYLAAQQWSDRAATAPGTVSAEVVLGDAQRSVRLDAASPFYATEAAKTTAMFAQSPQTVTAAFDRAFARYPVDPLAHSAYALYLVRSGNPREAARQLAIAELVNDAGNPEVEALKKAVRDALAGAGQSIVY